MYKLFFKDGTEKVMRCNQTQIRCYIELKGLIGYIRV